MWFLAPDLALAAAGFTLFFCLFLFDAPRKLFRDSDTGWHIRTGEGILANVKLPQTDPYSLTRSGRGWFAWEWASDVLMGAAHRWDGLRGVALLYITAIAACTWLWFRLHWAMGGDFLLACLMASPMLSTANLHWLARPHVFSWIFLLLALWAAERAPERFRPRHLAAAASFTALWANFHASFFFAPLFALAYGAGHFVRPMLWDLDRDREWCRARWYCLLALAAAAGSFLNPYGWRLHAHLLSYLGDTELLKRVGEFQTFNFHAEGSFQILLAVGIAAVGAALGLGQRKLAHFAVAAGLLAIALRSARGLPVAALLLLPLANGAITSSLRQAQRLAPALRARLAAALDYSANLRRIDSGLRGWAWAPALLLLVYAVMRMPAVAGRTGFPPDEFPVAAADRLESLQQPVRLLAPDKYGGYLIYRFQGRLKVFFDGRSDFYGVEFMKDYIRLVQVRPGWRQQVTSLGFTHALLPDDYSLVEALKRENWRVRYRDGVATLLERPGPGAAAPTGNTMKEED